MTAIKAIKVVGIKDAQLGYLDADDAIAYEDVPFANKFDMSNNTTEITFEGDATSEKVFSDNELSGTLGHDKLSPALLSKMFPNKILHTDGVTDRIGAINVTNGGSSYETAPTVTITAPDEDYGVQATAHAVLTADAVTSVVIDNAGTGYTSVPTIGFTGGGGSGAAATAALEELPAGVDTRLFGGDNSEFAGAPVELVATAACIVEYVDGTTEAHDMALTIPKANLSPLKLGGLANRAKQTFEYAWTAVKTTLDIAGDGLAGVPADGCTFIMDVMEA